MGILPGVRTLSPCPVLVAIILMMDPPGGSRGAHACLDLRRLPAPKVLALARETWTDCCVP